MTFQKIKKEFPNLKITDLNGGCNIYLPGKLTITVWFKKKKFFSNHLKVWRKFIDDEDIINIICVLGNIQMKNTVHVASQQSSDNQGTQACINHLTKKIETVMKNNPNDHKALNIYKSLKQEFHQFL